MIVAYIRKSFKFREFPPIANVRRRNRTAMRRRPRLRIRALPCGDLGDMAALETRHRQFLLTRSEEHTSELQSLMRISYAVFCLKKKNRIQQTIHQQT